MQGVLLDKVFLLYSSCLLCAFSPHTTQQHEDKKKVMASSMEFLEMVLAEISKDQPAIQAKPGRLLGSPWLTEAANPVKAAQQDQMTPVPKPAAASGSSLQPQNSAAEDADKESEERADLDGEPLEPAKEEQGLTVDQEDPKNQSQEDEEDNESHHEDRE